MFMYVDDGTLVNLDQVGYAKVAKEKQYVGYPGEEYKRHEETGKWLVMLHVNSGYAGGSQFSLRFDTEEEANACLKNLAGIR